MHRQDAPFDLIRPKAEGSAEWLGAAGARGAGIGRSGFIYPICCEMRTMPGLPTDPIAAHIDIDVKGNILGLS